MESVKQSVKQFAYNNKKKIIIWIVLLIIFIIAAVFVYVNYIQPQLVDMEYRANYEFDETIENELKPDTTSRGSKKPATIYLFWACWCPNSNKESMTGKKLHDTWDLLEKEYIDKKWSPSNKYSLDFKKVSEKNVNFDKFQKIVVKSGEIEGFPSIYLVREEKITNEGGHAMENIVYEFDANPTTSNLKEFISHVLKN